MSHSYNYYDPKNNALEKIKGTTKKRVFLNQIMVVISEQIYKPISNKTQPGGDPRVDEIFCEVSELIVLMDATWTIPFRFLHWPIERSSFAHLFASCN